MAKKNQQFNLEKPSEEFGIVGPRELARQVGPQPVKDVNHWASVATDDSSSIPTFE